MVIVIIIIDHTDPGNPDVGSQSMDNKPQPKDVTAANEVLQSLSCLS